MNASGNNVKISIGRTARGDLSVVVPPEFGSLRAFRAEFQPDGRIMIVMGSRGGVGATHPKNARDSGTQFRLSPKRINMKLPRNYPISGRSHDSLHAAMAIAYGPTLPGTHGVVNINDPSTVVRITTVMPIVDRYCFDPAVSSPQPLAAAPARDTSIIADGKQLIALANEWVKMARSEGVTPKLSITDDGLLSISITTAMSL